MCMGERKWASRAKIKSGQSAREQCHDGVMFCVRCGLDAALEFVSVFPSALCFCLAFAHACAFFSFWSFLECFHFFSSHARAFFPDGLTLGRLLIFCSFPPPLASSAFAASHRQFPNQCKAYTHSNLAKRPVDMRDSDSRAMS